MRREGEISFISNFKIKRLLIESLWRGSGVGGRRGGESLALCCISGGGRLLGEYGAESARSGWNWSLRGRKCPGDSGIRRQPVSGTRTRTRPLLSTLLTEFILFVMYYVIELRVMAVPKIVRNLFIENWNFLNIIKMKFYFVLRNLFPANGITFSFHLFRFK